MADEVSLIDPRSLKANEENPRLIFRQEDLDALQQSIADQGILVPLTVFRDRKSYRILDGERRWRCALKLKLLKVPAIVQPKPARLQNIMMMFAIHHARKDWAPLPTALKLKELEDEFSRVHGKKPSETELAGLASLSRGEVRRLKKLLALPEEYRTELLAELDKPRSEQVLTVDHVLEATTAAALLRKEGVVDTKAEDRLRRAIIKKFRTGVIANTVAPRKLARIARAVRRAEVPSGLAGKAIERLIVEPRYGIDEAFSETVEKVDFEHGLEQLATRVSNSLDEHIRRRYALSPRLAEALRQVQERIRRILHN